MHCFGYTDRFSAAPGEEIGFHVSASCSPVDVRFLRLINGDTNPLGPGRVEEPVALGPEGEYPVADEPVPRGSFATCSLPALESFTVELWAWPTLPRRGSVQGLVCCPGCFALTLDADGALSLAVGGQPGLRIDPGPRERRWSRIVASFNLDSADSHLSLESPALPAVAATAEGPLDARPKSDGTLLLAATGLLTPNQAEGLYNGKLDAVRVWNAAVDPSDAPDESLLAAFALAEGRADGSLVDHGPHGLRGTVHHLPRRPATGRAFSGEYDDPRQAPEHWSASHFHEDDLEDAAWPRTFSLQVPAELPSGVYAAHVVAGAAEDRIPFFVRPPRGCPGASVAVLFPTVSYLSYANERMQHKEFVHENGVLGQEIVPDAGDLLLSAHPELGSSLYDRHLDGDGVCLSSAHRPILNMRDSHRNWQTHAPRAFSADLYLEHWLDHEDIGHDVLTDHDLQAEGRALLDPYQVLITGSHPEYWTARMWDALSGWLAAGGRLMYLGGNGFYWVTSFDPTRPHVIEIQRGVCGIRCWESAAGEMHHVTTGEPGGLWRNRGPSPNALVGVGFAAQGFDERAPGYRRLPVSQRSELAWAFDGIDEEEVIGDFGLAMGGAAGDEIDRHDVRYGSPPEAVVVATSQGAHSDYYMLVCEDIPVTHPNIGGQTCPDVRADIVLMPTAEGGAVFSTGSMAWTASLSWENYANNVARLTGSVLRRFLDPEPLKLELKSNDESRFVNTNTNSQGNP